MNSDDPGRTLESLSWCSFSFDAPVHDWVQASLSAAKQTRYLEAQQQWLRCGGTWFAGVNALSNDERGAIADGPPFAGAAFQFLREYLGDSPPKLEPAQVSICYPGYPQPMATESEAAFRYRVTNCAAHVDGILPEGEARRRHLREHHQFILGIPMTQYDAGAAPPVVWEGSHEIVREVLGRCFSDSPPEKWGDVDITEIYHNLRTRIFADCPRVEIVAQPGETYVIHRLALHGILPWQEGASADADGRIICYFRPETPSARDWLLHR